MRAPAKRSTSTYALVWLLALAALAAIAGDRLSQPSRNNHFVHLADGWLHGRLSLEHEPPGWRKGRADDWARVWTVELASGETFRGQRCRTTPCRDQEQASRVRTWWTTTGEFVVTPRRDIVDQHATWYVSFPPGPALLMLPGVAWLGLDFPDVAFTVVLAAFIPVLLLWGCDRVRGPSQEHLWMAAAFALGSPACFVAANGSVWFTAQIAAALGLTVFLACAWQLRWPAAAGLALAFATACRPHLALAAGLFGVIWWRGGRSWPSALRFAIPLMLGCTALAALNLARFDDPLEFGHRYLEIRWQQRMQEVGLFSPRYLGRNLTCLLVLWPQWHGGTWPLRVSIHGLGLLWTTPWLLWAATHRHRFHGRSAVWLASLALAIPSLLYHNSGQLQFTYRFALDWLPIVLWAMVLGGAFRSRGVKIAITFAIVVQLGGAWLFTHAPRKLFVREPVGWPFEAEFE
ncbi:MAG: hypothetical protein B7733_19275, partial [Myxococcales bacterium FL481]